MRDSVQNLDPLAFLASKSFLRDRTIFPYPAVQVPARPHPEETFSIIGAVLRADPFHVRSIDPRKLGSAEGKSVPYGRAGA